VACMSSVVVVSDDKVVASVADAVISVVVLESVVVEKVTSSA